MSVLIVSTPVGPVGSGVGGGVELTLRNIADGLAGLGHRVEVVAPHGSVHVGHVLHHVSGRAEPSVQHFERSTPLAEPRADAVLSRMWKFVGRHAARFDVVVNLAYDALPFIVGRSLGVPVAHLVSMGSLTDAMDAVIDAQICFAPESVAMHSRAQAATFARGSLATIVGGGIDVASYDFRPQAHADGRLAFVGRVSPEKGLRDAVEVASRSGRPLHVWGLLQDEIAWQESIADFPAADIRYRGFVPTAQLQRELGDCAALVVTSKWVEAFGNVAIEALACGVPVVTYGRGGPAEIVADGRTGFVVPPDDPGAMSRAVESVDRISRAACRAAAEAEHSTDALARRVDAWLRRLLQGADFPPIPLSF